MHPHYQCFRVTFFTNKAWSYVMKIILPIILSILLGVANGASAKNSNHQHNARVGLHGMLLFSDGQSLYASHLPMFHAPHDMQLIVRFELANSVNHTKLRNALVNNSNYWTLSPERFDLTQLAQNKKGIWQFTADLYSDHFERGGTLELPHQNIIVKDVIFRQQLNRDMPKTAEYIRLTPNGVTRQFYARIIEGKPGVDHLFWINSASSLMQKFSIEGMSTSLSNEEIAHQLNVNPIKVHAYYLEHGDLK